MRVLITDDSATIRMILKGLLKQLQSEGKLFVIMPNPRGEPAHQPISGRKHHCFLEAIIRTLLLASEQDVPASQPNIRSVAAFFDGGI